MDTAPSVDRRKQRRYPLTGGVQFYHAPSQREFPGRCVDISRGGLLMYVPLTAPLQVGHALRLTLPGLDQPNLGDLSEKSLEGTVVRVDRRRLLELGYLAVGVQFATA